LESAGFAIELLFGLHAITDAALKVGSSEYSAKTVTTRRVARTAQPSSTAASRPSK
jgi:hypothetical protein